TFKPDSSSSAMASSRVLLIATGTSIGLRPPESVIVISSLRVTSVPGSGSIETTLPFSVSSLHGVFSSIDATRLEVLSSAKASSSDIPITSGISKCSGPLETISVTVAFLAIDDLGAGCVETTLPLSTSSSNTSRTVVSNPPSCNSDCADASEAFKTLGSVLYAPGPIRKYQSPAAITKNRPRSMGQKLFRPYKELNHFRCFEAGSALLLSFLGDSRVGGP